MTVRTVLAAGLLSFAVSLPAFAAPVTYIAVLDGPSEAPPNASPGTGTATVTIDTAANTMRVQASFKGLTGTTTAAHIHCCTAVPLVGTVTVATTTPSFVGFPLGVTAGDMDMLYDMTLASSFRAAYITANGGTTATAFAALAAGIADGKAYFNIHTTTFTGGEIRGFLVPDTSVVPVPAGAPLMLGGLVAMGAFLRRRKG